MEIDIEKNTVKLGGLEYVIINKKKFDIMHSMLTEPCMNRIFNTIAEYTKMAKKDLIPRDFYIADIIYIGEDKDTVSVAKNYEGIWLIIPPSRDMYCGYFIRIDETEHVVLPLNRYILSIYYAVKITHDGVIVRDMTNKIILRHGTYGNRW